MPITKLQADFDGAENPFPVSPSNVRVSSINSIANESTLVDWSTDLSSWSGSTGELSVVQDSISGRNGSITQDFIEGNPITVPEDGADAVSLYDTSNAVNISDEPSVLVGFEREQLLGSNGLHIEIESNRTNVDPTTENSSDRYISLAFGRGLAGEGLFAFQFTAKHQDSGVESTFNRIPMRHTNNVTYPNDYLSVSFSKVDASTISATVQTQDGQSVTEQLSISTTIPSNPNTRIMYTGAGPKVGSGDGLER
jgi:hypothetical protein